MQYFVLLTTLTVDFCYSSFCHNPCDYQPTVGVWPELGRKWGTLVIYSYKRLTTELLVWFSAWELRWWQLTTVDRDCFANCYLVIMIGVVLLSLTPSPSRQTLQYQIWRMNYHDSSVPSVPLNLYLIELFNCTGWETQEMDIPVACSLTTEFFAFLGVPDC